MPSKKPKYLFIIGCFHPSVGGTETACRLLARGVAAQGCAVSILTQYREGLPSCETMEGYTVYRYIKAWHFFELSYMLSVLSFLVRNRRKYDGILCFGCYLFTPPAVLFARLTGRKAFIRLRSSAEFQENDKLSMARFIRWCARRAGGAIALTEQIEQELVRQGFPADNIIRISNGVDTRRFAPNTARDEEPLVLCYAGRLVEGKGLETFIESLAEVSRHTQAFRAVIAGDGSLRGRLSGMVEKYGLRERVDLLGEQTNVAAVYRQSHVFVLPSLAEGMPMSLLEAMACGLPAAATAIGGVSELLGGPRPKEKSEPGCQIRRNGIAFAPGDDRALAAALLRLIRDRELLGRLSRSAIETVQRGYRIEGVVRKYRALLDGSRRL